ncbi:hypothetical protein J8F10_07050 [Gemmata sp. G18]|uniref:Uncharacterized protein n=1 Tax=Gemmata palustris TaxID=2822762 RepID=A0ABS5BMS9_9BACT|nr:hypothetical protein [Gemmata palustris]MBP3955038.1 hypothetical protein [Gemmata palustris]
MTRRPYDPLAFVPHPDVVRDKLRETLTLAERLRLLLELAERLQLPLTTADLVPAPAERKAVTGE